MIRLTEIALLLLPIAAFVGWRVFTPGRPFSVGMIVAGGVFLGIMGAALLWLRAEDAAPPDSFYIPQHMENGRIVTGQSIRR